MPGNLCHGWFWLELVVIVVVGSKDKLGRRRRLVVVVVVVVGFGRSRIFFEWLLVESIVRALALCVVGGCFGFGLFPPLVSLVFASSDVKDDFFFLWMRIGQG